MCNMAVKLRRIKPGMAGAAWAHGEGRKQLLF
jgi:hypothetical protein